MHIHFQKEIELKVKDVYDDELRVGYIGPMAGYLRPKMIWQEI
jgi:hypothetical protein